AVATCAWAAAARLAGGGDLHRAETAVRRPADRAGAATSGPAHQSEAGRGLDGAPGACGTPEETLADHDGLAPRRADRTEPAPARFLGLGARSRLGRRYDVPA